MPIEIKSLHIEVSVKEKDKAGNQKKPGTEAVDKEEIIKECLEQCVEIIKDKKER